MRAIGIFADLAYLPSLIALINSIRYFGVRARIKVYDFNGLPHLARSCLSGHAEVVSPPAEAFGDHYRAHQNFRPRILSAAGIDPHELVLDADAVVLCDLEEAFQEIERGHLVVLKEWEYVHAERDPRRREVPPDSVLHRILEHPEIYQDRLPIYNAGILGFHRERHARVLDLWARSTHDHDRLRGTLFRMEQNKLALIVASLLRDGELTLHELPPELWMQTWAAHGTPKKLLGFEGGRIALYNGSVARRMRFYHYTGGVGPPEAIDPEDRYAVRFNDLVSDLGVPAELTQGQMADAWHHVWRARYDSPAGELPRFFYDQGPLRAPKCMDPGWREALARLLRGFGAEAAIGRDSKETWALALAHDYFDLCGFRAGDLGWLAEPLRALLGPERLATGEATVAWQAEADVTLGFRAGYADVVEWTGGEHRLRARYTEHHRGVFFDIR